MTREETIHELGEWLEQMVQHGVPSHSAKRKALATAIALLSAEAVPQSEQYKKGFEDAKRAFLVEYARESRNMRKRQLEVMLNAQKAISAEAEWIPCSERLPSESGWYVVTVCGNERIVDVLPYNSGWDGVTTKQEVVAWMPLPKPYRKEDEDDGKRNDIHYGS